MTLYSVDTLSGREVREGGLVTAYAVTAANLIKDVRSFPKPHFVRSEYQSWRRSGRSSAV